MHIIFEQFRVVVGHFLEVRHQPAFVDRIAVKASGQLIIGAAERHLLERSGENMPQALVPRARVLINQQIDDRRMRKFRSAESTISRTTVSDASPVCCEKDSEFASAPSTSLACSSTSPFFSR